MKKLLALLTAIFGLVSLSAHAEDAETAPTLWPACDPATGLWGYITEDGAWGIAPQYTGAGHFHDGCAIVSVGEQEDPALYYLEDAGIIDETGAFLLEPEYGIYDFCDENAGDIFFVNDDGPDGEFIMGWFNIPNRYFSGLHWMACYAYADTPWVLVDNDLPRSGLANRATGEIILPLEYSYTGLYDQLIEYNYSGLDDHLAEGGFVVAERAGTLENELIEIGVGKVELPEGVFIDYADGVGDGLVVFEKDGLYGYLNTAGKIVIPAQFSRADTFVDGYANVRLPGEDFVRVIDRQGQTAVVADTADWWTRPYIRMVDGALCVIDTDSSWRLVEPDGRVRCRHEMPEDTGWMRVHQFAPDGPIWIKYALADEEYLWALMSREGEMLAEPRWDWVNHRDGEPWLTVCEDGHWRYLDAYGSEMASIDGECRWAETFRGALAFVRFDEETDGYVNRAGEIVCRWPVEED